MRVAVFGDTGLNSRADFRNPSFFVVPALAPLLDWYGASDDARRDTVISFRRRDSVGSAGASWGAWACRPIAADASMSRSSAEKASLASADS